MIKVICVYLLYLQSISIYYLDLVVLTVEYSFSVLSLHTLLATLEEKHKHTKHNFHVSGQIELSVVTSASKRSIRRFVITKKAPTNVRLA